MDLPFVIFIPFGRGGQETARRVPPASLQLPRRTAETYYEMVVTVGYGSQDRKQYAFPVPIARYDTLSTFGMYNRPETAERVSDHLVTLGISLPRWSYGPLDPVSVYIKLSPNLDWLSKARKVTIRKIEIGIDEEVIYNHEGDEPQRKSKSLVKKTENVGVKMPEAGYFTNLGLVFPANDLRDADGIMPRGKAAFPTYAVTGFTTTAGLYKVEYYLTIKVCDCAADPLPALLTTFYIGVDERSQRHHLKTADRSVPSGSRSMQGRNGGYRTGRSRRLACECRQPNASPGHHHTRIGP